MAVVESKLGRGAQCHFAQRLHVDMRESDIRKILMALGAPSSFCRLVAAARARVTVDTTAGQRAADAELEAL